MQLGSLLALIGSAASMSAQHRHPPPFLSSTNTNNLDHQSFRTLEQENDQEYEDSYSWLIDYSLKFYSCHTVTEYSIDENGYGSLWVQRLVKFKLCTVEQCDWNCKGGKYLVSMEDFLVAYANRMEVEEKYTCQNALDDCECAGDDYDDDDNDDGNGDNDCEYNCFVDAGLDHCVDGDDADDDDGSQLDIRDYAECQALDMADADEDEEQLYIGLKCSNSGQGIGLGIFTDDACMAEKDNGDADSFESFPYLDESFVTSGCITCAEPQLNEDDEEEGNGQYDDDAGGGSKLSEICTTNYDEAAKCETYMNLDYPDYNACDLIDNIPLGVRQSKTKSTIAALLVASVFFLSAAFLAVIAMYLVRNAKKRQINLIHDNLQSDIIPVVKPTHEQSFKTWFSTIFN